jgi:nitrogenase subunit NifH
MIISSALGYIFKAVSKNKTVVKAENELLTNFWQRQRPHFIKDVPEIESHPDAPETKAKAQKQMLKLVQDEKFYQSLAEQVKTIQASPLRIKNSFKGELDNVRVIKIGNKEYNPNESYDQMNIFEGKASNADSFTLGDG